MVSPHFKVHAGSRAKGKSGVKHFKYLTRQGGRAKKRDDLVMVKHGNYPNWASENELKFWKEADSRERANARIYEEYEVALPRELDRSGQIELISDFVEREWGNRHVYTWAFHCPNAMDGKENPHFHIMFSTRKLDENDRDEKLFFKRANADRPELGGNGKSPDWNRRAKVKEMRMAWESSINRAFARYGIDKVANLKSLAERGIDRIPEPKLGARQTYLLKKGMPNENTELVRELRESRRLEFNLNEVFRDIDGTIRDLAKAEVEQSRYIRLPANKVKAQVTRKKYYLYEELKRVENRRYELGLTHSKGGERYSPSSDSEIVAEREALSGRFMELQSKLTKVKRFESELQILGTTTVSIRRGQSIVERESLSNQDKFVERVNSIVSEQLRDLSQSRQRSLEPTDSSNDL